MADELLDRLEGWQDYEPARMFGGEILKDVAEAAAEIARLRDENKHVGGLWVAETRENERLRAENERKTAALECVNAWIKSRQFVPSVNGVRMEGEPIIGPKTQNVFDAVDSALTNGKPSEGKP